MDDGDHLHDLCRVCNARTPKYCCPRCHMRTCSLQCCKRHKLWSSCSGKRDPAAKIAKKDLATPAAFDHDYNFLTGLERMLDKTSRETKELHGEAEGSAFRSSKVQDYAKSVRLEIIKAPKGLSRQKRNETRWIGGEERRGIKWTVEWVDPAGEQHTGQCMDSLPLGAAYMAVRKARPGFATEQSRKRKRQFPGLTVFDHQYQVTRGTDVGPTTEETPTTAAGPDDERHKTVERKAEEANEEEKEGDHRQNFYLVKPLTTSAQTVLIPFQRNTTLNTLLEGKTILEYPTIQVLEESPENLPKGFQLESDYIKEHLKMVEEIEQEWTLGGTVGADDANEQGELVGVVNDTKVLESLQRDVEGA